MAVLGLVGVISTAYGVTSLRSGGAAVAESSPCVVISRAEAEVLMGPLAGEPRITGTGDGCQYRSNDPSGLSVLVHFTHSTSTAVARKAAVAAGATVKDLDDGSFLASSADARVHSAESIIDDRVVKVLVQRPKGPPAPADEARARSFLSLVGSRP